MFTVKLLNINKASVYWQSQFAAHPHRFQIIIRPFPTWVMARIGTVHFMIITSNHNLETIWLVLDLSFNLFSFFNQKEMEYETSKEKPQVAWKSLLSWLHVELTLIIRSDLRRCPVMWCLVSFTNPNSQTCHRDSATMPTVPLSACETISFSFSASRPVFFSFFLSLFDTFRIKCTRSRSGSLDSLQSIIEWDCGVWIRSICFTYLLHSSYCLPQWAFDWQCQR